MELLEIIDKLKVDQKGYAGDLITREQIEALKDRAIAIAEKNAERILDGEADIFPTSNGCKYCRFAEICRFDPLVDCRIRAAQKQTLEDLLSKGGADE